MHIIPQDWYTSTGIIHIYMYPEELYGIIKAAMFGTSIHSIVSRCLFLLMHICRYSALQS
jgi:hypothetical protein